MPAVAQQDHVVLLFLFSEDLHTVPVSGCTDWHSTVCEVPFSDASSTFVVCFLDDYRSDWGEMESQCSFDLHFLYG
jgi:hypothetical protein